MSKKGFTIIELIVSFTLVTVISIMLFQLIFSLKELYVSGDIKTTLLNKQGIMVKKIYEDLNNKDLTSITSCGVSCLTFSYSGENKNLLVDVAANTLTYDNYTMKLSEGSYFDEIDFKYGIIDTSSTSLDNSEYNISIPIRSKFLSNDDFGIHIIKTYNSNEVTINNHISVSSAKLTANGINLDLRADNEITNTRTIWTQIFHQDQIGTDLSSTDSYFQKYEEFIKTNSTHKKSSLKSLDVFRIKNPVITYLDSNNVLKTDNLIEITKTNKLNELKNQNPSLTELPAKEAAKIDESYQDGFFELLLEYPTLSATNYNLWTQTSNFVKTKTLENSYSIDIMYQGSSYLWNGLKYITDTNSNQFVNGCQGGYNFALGVRKANTTLKGPDGDTNNVNLWIKADEYIDKYALSIID